jgi:uncharacterized membrane protein
LETTRSRRIGQPWAFVWISVFLAIIAIVVTANLELRPVGYYPWYPFGSGWIWTPFAFFFLFFAFRWFFWPRGWGYRGYSTGDDAYYILRGRFARGEITKEQFEQVSRDLQELERT